MKILLDYNANPKLKDSNDNDPLFYQTNLLEDPNTKKTAKEIKSKIQKGKVQ